MEHLVEAARVEVSLGLEREFALLAGTQSETLRAWCATLIPAAADRPGAEAVGAAEYVDATCAGAPALAEALLGGLDELDTITGALFAQPFRQCELSARVRALGELERLAPEVFAMVRDFTYEAYYAHPRVLAALERLTGWQGMAPGRGTPLPSFDERLLGRVLQLPPLYRSAS